MKTTKETLPLGDKQGFVSNYGEWMEYGFPHFKTPYNHNTEAEARLHGTVNTEPTKTQQSQADDADINTIVKRFGLTGRQGEIPMPPSIGEWTDVMDYQSALNLVLAAKASFEKLPPQVRDTFNGNPANFVAYVDEAVAAGDLGQLREWGLAVAAPPSNPPVTAPEGPKTDPK